MLFHSLCEAVFIVVFHFVINLAVDLIGSGQCTTSAGEFGWGGTPATLQRRSPKVGAVRTEIL